MAEMNIIDHPLYKRDLKKIEASVPWQTLKGKSIAITGASGLLGSQLIDFLIFLNKESKAGIKIKALGRNKEKLEQRFAYSNDHEVDIIKYDLFLPFPDIEVDYLIHCAGNSHPKLFSEDPVGTIMGNIRGTEEVLMFARNKSVETLLLSSGEVYGNNELDIPMTESYSGPIDLSNFRSCYPEGKRAIEVVCQSYIKQYGVKAKIARPCRIFGPTMTESDNKATAQFLRRGLRKEDIILKSNGNQLFSYIYSADAISALLTILIRGKVGEAYNVSSDKCNARLKDVAFLISQETNVDVVFDITGEPGGSLVQNALLDNSKLCRLGWKSKYDLRESIISSVRILRDQGLYEVKS